MTQGERIRHLLLWALCHSHEIPSDCGDFATMYDLDLVREHTGIDAGERLKTWRVLTAKGMYAARGCYRVEKRRRARLYAAGRERQPDGTFLPVYTVEA